MIKTLKVYSLEHDFLDIEINKFVGDMYFATQEASDTLTLNKDELEKNLIESISRLRKQQIEEYDDEDVDVGFYLLLESNVEFDTDDEDFATDEDIEGNLRWGHALDRKVVAIYTESGKEKCDKHNFEKLFHEEYGDTIVINYPEQ